MEDIGLVKATILKLNTGAILGTLICGYFFALLLYGIFLQPLRKFPGPFITRISRVPYWYAAFTGNEARYLRELHSKYGPVVRYGTGELSYTDPRAWREIYGYEKGKTENPKDVRIYGKAWNGASTIVTADFETHARFRRVLAPAFSDRALSKQEPLFKKYVNLMVSKVRTTVSTKPGQPVDMVKILNFTTFDIMAELTFSEPLGLLENSAYTAWVQRIADSVWVRSVLSFMAYYPIAEAIFNLIQPKSFKEIGNAHFQHSAERVDRRLSKGSDQPDIWNLVLSANEESFLSVDEMHANADFIMAAGSETTATLLSGIIYYLLRHPSKMDMLMDEIRHEFARDEDIGWTQLSNMTYLNACIDEGLRMFPPIPSTMPRITPAGGNLIMNEWIPPGTSISVNHGSTYRSPSNFKNPDQFVPERWLGDPQYKDDKREALQPFSLGPRNCIGKNMALHESRLILVKLLYNFDFQLCDGMNHWDNQKVWLIRRKTPLMCRLTPRDHQPQSLDS